MLFLWLYLHQHRTFSWDERNNTCSMGEEWQYHIYQVGRNIIIITSMLFIGDTLKPFILFAFRKFERCQHEAKKL